METLRSSGTEELRSQFLNALLIVLTVAAVICAGVNFAQLRKSSLPDDGVTWVDRPSGVEALHVVPESPGARAGIREGDLLRAIDEVEIGEAIQVPAVLASLGSWNKTEYKLHRASVDLTATVIVGVREAGPEVYYQYLVGGGYLFIGLFVYFRRSRARRATHFYVLCLTSFVLFTFHYTGRLNHFDQLIYWGNVAAGVFAPTVFLHFCLRFPSPSRWARGRLRASLLYLPAAALVLLYALFATGALRVGVSLIEVRWFLDRLWLPLLMTLYIAGSLVLTGRYSEVKSTVARQQMKWLRNGALAGVLPFAFFYAIPYSLGVVPTHSMELSVFSMALIPVTWAYAILRYRLMDVDIIFQQGYVYTLTTLCVIGIVYGLVLALGEFENLSPTAIVVLVLIAAFVFQPIRGWMQDLLDRHVFYKDHYDYRRTLVEFVRELSSDTDLDATLSAVADRLMRTLAIRQSAFFLASEYGDGFELYGAYRLEGAHSERVRPEGPLDLSFLPREPREPYLFFEQTRHSLDITRREMAPGVRQAIATLGLTYYLPCAVRGRTIAYLGVSRTVTDDFLTSDDIELLLALCGYAGIAVENARLYRSLQAKVEQYERLKEFNENIVESINVGIVAVGLDERIEGWNAPMEKLTGITREAAVNRTLSEIFPGSLVEQLRVPQDDFRIQNLYKFPLDIVPPAVAEALVHAAGAGNGAGPGANGSAPEPALNGASGDSAGTSAERQERIVNVAVAPLVTRSLEHVGRLIIFDDVTERTELERQLMQADKLSSIGLLAAGVAHEVNTPLAVISTYAQMLAKQLSGDDSKSLLLDKITRQTFRASEIVNSLLNFSRTSPTQWVQVDLNQVIRDTVPLIEHQLAKAGVKTELALAERLSAVRGNAGKLQQVFLNLFLNARDAMENGGTLTVSTEPGPDCVRIAISDTGHGIPSELIERIYDPFFTTKGIRRGTGLGLSITYGIVREHGGSISVSSQPGEGTRFSIEFPAVRKTVHA